MYINLFFYYKKNEILKYLIQLGNEKNYTLKFGKREVIIKYLMVYYPPVTHTFLRIHIKKGVPPRHAITALIYSAYIYFT
jgi:hypothetical protein